ncbi:MAG: LysR family transcriptional regulator [Burkholderiaceae bacterium]
MSEINPRHVYGSLDLKQLGTFLAVADARSITRAADVLHLVQPAVSRQIKLLEEALGTPLFQRKRHGVELTEAGTILASHARRSLQELERARAEIAARSAPVSGIVTVGLLPSTCDLLSSRLVTAVERQHPGIRLRVSASYAGDLQQMLEAGDIDLALLYAPRHSEALQLRPLLDERLWVVGTPAQRLHRDRPFALSRLDGQRVVLPSAPHGLRRLVDHACALAGVTLDVVAETNSMNVQKNLVIGGHGLSILPSIAVVGEVARGDLSAAPLCEPPLSRRIVLAMSALRPAGPAVRYVVDALTRCARDAVDSGDWMEGRWLGPTEAG